MSSLTLFSLSHILFQSKVSVQLYTEQTHTCCSHKHNHTHTHANSEAPDANHAHVHQHSNPTSLSSSTSSTSSVSSQQKIHHNHSHPNNVKLNESEAKPTATLRYITESREKPSDHVHCEDASGSSDSEGEDYSAETEV
jgi:hypothetical protein